MTYLSFSLSPHTLNIELHPLPRPTPTAPRTHPFPPPAHQNRRRCSRHSLPYKNAQIRSLMRAGRSRSYGRLALPLPHKTKTTIILNMNRNRNRNGDIRMHPHQLQPVIHLLHARDQDRVYVLWQHWRRRRNGVGVCCGGAAERRCGCGVSFLECRPGAFFVDD